MPHLFLFLKHIQPGLATTCLTGGVCAAGKESLLLPLGSFRIPGVKEARTVTVGPLVFILS